MMLSAVGDVVPELILLIGAALTLAAALILPARLQWLGAPLALASLTVSAVAAIRLLDEGQRVAFFGTWALDGATHGGRLLILVAAAAVVMLSPEWFRTDPRHGEYYSLLLLSTLGAVLMAGAADAMQLVIGVLLTSVTGYTLAAFHRRSALATEAGMKFFLIGGIANPLLTMGVVILFGVTGTTVYQAMPEPLNAADPIALAAVVTLVGAGIAYELGAVPAHAWMPDVAQGAPAPSAAFLTIVPKIGALVAFARLLSVLPDPGFGWRPVAALLAAATMTLGNLAALWQEDVRRLLGWSAVSQSGYALMAVVALGRSDLALPGLLFFLGAYTLGNLAAFAVVVELRGRTALVDYQGLAARRPWLAAALVLSFLSLVGIPPLAGFTGKLTLFAATLEAGYGWLAALAVVNTVVSLFYYLRVVGPMYLAEPPATVPVLGRWAAVPARATSAGVLVVGVVAEPLLDWLRQATLLPS